MNLQKRSTLNLIQESIYNQQNGIKTISLTDKIGNQTRYSEKQGIITTIKNNIYKIKHKRKEAMICCIVL